MAKEVYASWMALAGLELETLVSDPDALATRPTDVLFEALMLIQVLYRVQLKVILANKYVNF